MPQWRRFDDIPSWSGDFVWVQRASGEVELAYFRRVTQSPPYFFSPEACGDSEGLYTDVIADVAYWRETETPPAFTE